MHLELKWANHEELGLMLDKDGVKSEARRKSSVGAEFSISYKIVAQTSGSFSSPRQAILHALSEI